MKRMSLFSRFKKEDKEEHKEVEKGVSNSLRLCYLKRIEYLGNELQYVSNLKEVFESRILVERTEVENIFKHFFELGEQLGKLTYVLIDDDFRSIENANRFVINTGQQILKGILKIEDITGEEVVDCLDKIERLLRVDLFRSKNKIQVV